MQIKKIDLIIIKFLYACNIPFNVVENDAFHNLISILRPSYKLPSWKKMVGSLLDSVNDQVEELIHESLKATEGTPVIDRRSNIHIEPTIASFVHINGKS